MNWFKANWFAENWFAMNWFAGQGGVGPTIPGEGTTFAPLIWRYWRIRL